MSGDAKVVKVPLIKVTVAVFIVLYHITTVDYLYHHNLFDYPQQGRNNKHNSYR